MNGNKEPLQNSANPSCVPLEGPARDERSALLSQVCASRSLRAGHSDETQSKPSELFKGSSLYIHVPFCTKKCPYCHFYVVPNQGKESYLKALKKEWELRGPFSPETIYFGGGTPYLLDPEDVREILSWMPHDNIEITLEANPDEMTPEKTKSFAKAGINRLSIGVQSLDDNLLHTIGRTHTAKQAIESVQGIDNISIDLMLDLPNQTPEQVQRTFEEAIKLPITHVSLYNLILEPPSLFYSKRKTIKQPHEEDSLKMLQIATETLTRAGFERYEISAFAKPGYRSQHNMGYWLGRPFIGLGPSAFSYLNGERFQNIKNIRKYEKMLSQDTLPTDYREKLDEQASKRELLAIRLRMTDWVKPEKLTQPLLNLLDQKLLEQKDDLIRLTEKGQLFYDTVASEII